MSRTRRKFNSAFKAKVAIEAIKEQRTISELAQEFEIHPNHASQWKPEFLERSAQFLEGYKKQAEELAISEHWEEELRSFYKECYEGADLNALEMS